MKDKKKYARTLLRRYIKLMRFAQNRDPKLLEGVYTEKHHAFPVSIYGKNSTLVVLTYKEHLVAHHLLHTALAHRYGEKHQKSVKMWYALIMMTASSYKLGGRLTAEPRVISAAIKKFNQFGKNNHQYGKPLKPETIKKISEALSGEKNPFYGRAHTDETKSQISAARVGKTAGEHNPSYDPTTYTWYNYRYDILETKLTYYQLKKKYQDLVPRSVSALKIGLAKESNDWIIVEGPIDSLESEIDRKAGTKPKYLEPVDWLNLKSGCIELKLTCENFARLYPSYNLRSLRDLSSGKAKQCSDWVILDSSEVESKSYLSILSGYYQKYPTYMPVDWIDIKTGSIELQTSAQDLLNKYSKQTLNISKLSAVVRGLRKTHKGWSILNINS